MASIVTFFVLCFLAALSASAAGAQYVVQEGESLGAISRKTGVSVVELQRANNLSGETIYMGQTLVIPGETAAAAAEAAPMVHTASASGPARRALPVALPSGGSSPAPFHTVTQGDTLSAIARRYNTTTARLRDLNGMTGDRILLGQKLRVREDLPVATVGEIPASPGAAAGRSEVGGSGGVYVVESGDTLSAISRKTGVTVSRLRQVNGLEGDTIFAGQKLVLGEGSAVGAGSSTAAPANPSPEPGAVAGSVHTVTDGETLFSISRQYKVPVPDLRRANRLDSDNIWVGQKLEIPGTDGSPSAPGNSASAPTGLASHAPDADDGMISPTTPVSRMPVDPVWERPGHYLDLAVSPGSPAPQNHAAMETARTPERAQPQTLPAGESYVVQPGDTLWRISREHGVDIDEIRQANSLSGDTIIPGNTLRIPSS